MKPHAREDTAEAAAIPGTDDPVGGACVCSDMTHDAPATNRFPPGLLAAGRARALQSLRMQLHPQRLRSTFHDADLPAARRAAARARASVTVDLLAGGSERVPLGAEVVEPFAGGLAGALVADEAVDRMPGVAHLALAVARSRQSKQRLVDAPARARDALARERRPVRGAARVAHADAAAVLLEQVERTAACIHEDRAERRLLQGDECAGRGP